MPEKDTYRRFEIHSNSEHPVDPDDGGSPSHTQTYITFAEEQIQIQIQIQIYSNKIHPMQWLFTSSRHGRYYTSREWSGINTHAIETGTQTHTYTQPDSSADA